jgi:hypothetical protein
MKDNHNRPVEVFVTTDHSIFAHLKGRPETLAIFSKSNRGLLKPLTSEYPEGPLAEDKSDEDGWSYFRPAVSCQGPEGVSVETHEIETRYVGASWTQELADPHWNVLSEDFQYRYRPRFQPQLPSLKSRLQAALPDLNNDAIERVLSAVREGTSS